MSQNNIKDTLVNDLKNKKAWIPNGLTMLRLFGPIIIPKMALSKNIPGTLGVTALLALTDFADGKVARKLDATTELGKKLDPIVDKIFALGLLGQAIPSNKALAIPLILESIIATINASSLINGGNPQSSQSGRMKMWPLSAAIISEYLAIATDKPQFKTATNAYIAAAAILETINIFDYYEAAKKDKSNNNQEITTSDIEINNLYDETDTKDIEPNETTTETKSFSPEDFVPSQITYQKRKYIKYNQKSDN